MECQQGLSSTFKTPETIAHLTVHLGWTWAYAPWHILALITLCPLVKLSAVTQVNRSVGANTHILTIFE